MQPDRLAVAAAWMAAGERDLRVAERLCDDEPALACFHAQQAAEKALKAAAVVVSGDVERSHSLVRLVRELVAAGRAVPDDVARAAQILERYYAPTRYPDALGGVDPGEVFVRDDALETLAFARTVVAFGRAVAIPIAPR